MCMALSGVSQKAWLFSLEIEHLFDLYWKTTHCEIPLTEDVPSIYMLLLGLCELPHPQEALLSWQCINQNWNFDVNGAKSINCFKSLCDLHCPRGLAVIVIQRSYHALMLSGLDSLLPEIVRTKLYMDTGNYLGSMLFSSQGLTSLGRPQHFLGTQEFSFFSGLLSAWFVKYQDHKFALLHMR